MRNLFRNRKKKVEKGKERKKNGWRKKEKASLGIFPFLIYNSKDHLFKVPIPHPLMRVVSNKKWPSPPPDVFN